MLYVSQNACTAVSRATFVCSATAEGAGRWKGDGNRHLTTVGKMGETIENVSTSVNKCRQVSAPEVHTEGHRSHVQRKRGCFPSESPGAQLLC